ncbi:MAG: hypothetical protein QXI58_04335, partial [Candidatus Micrarchaeia archaeon]
KIGALADFLFQFTEDSSLKSSSGGYLIVSSQAPSPDILNRLSSTSVIPWAHSLNLKTTSGVNYEKLKRALWGRLSPSEFNYDLYHIEVLQRRKQIEYFIHFKECKETKDPKSKIGKKIKELSEKYCGKYNGRDPSLSVTDLVNDLRKAEEEVAFLYSPSQDKEVGPCKIKTNVNTGNSPRGHFFTIELSAEISKLNYCTSGSIGSKFYLVNNTPEPIGILVFRIYDPGYWDTRNYTINFSPTSTDSFSLSRNQVVQKIFWEFSTSSTSSYSFFRAVIERWVDPDWNGPDFLDVAKTHVKANEKNFTIPSYLPIAGADFVDFQFCTQDQPTINLGFQIRNQYRGEILLTNYYQKDNYLQAFVLDPEGEPLPKQLKDISPSDLWLDVINTAYSEHEARKCVEVKEPPPTLLKETIAYTWPFIARSNEVNPPFFYYVPLSAQIGVFGQIFSWLGREPRDRKLTFSEFAAASQAEEHAMWDTAFNYHVTWTRGGPAPQTHPVPPEYEINLCHPAQYPTRLRWTLIPYGTIEELKNFLLKFATETQDLLNVLEDKKVKEKCIQTNYLNNFSFLPDVPYEWSGRYLKKVRSSYNEQEVEECVKALTQAIQREIDKKCPPNQQWINVQTTPFRAVAQKMQLEIDWRNDAYYLGNQVILPPFPELLWFFDLKNSYFPSWPRVNIFQLRYVDLIEYTGEKKENPKTVGPWGQKWHFRLATAYYKREEIQKTNDLFEIRYNLYGLEDLKKELALDPLFGNQPNLLEAERKKENPPFIINRLQTLNIPELGRTLSNKIMIKESASIFGGLVGETMRVAIPIPRFLSQIRYRPTEAYLKEQRCTIQDFNFWQGWSSIGALWRNPDLLGRKSTDVNHSLRRTIEIWYTHGKNSDPSGVNDVELEKIREIGLKNELYFYILPCQDEFGKPGNCYGWFGFKWKEGELKLTYEPWMEGVFKFAITGFPPGDLAPGTSTYPGTNPTPQELPPVKIPNKFIWGNVRGGARYLLEMARGLIEPSNLKDDRGANISERREIRLFSPPDRNEIFVNVFKEEGPYSWTVRTCADYCDELQEHQTPKESYVLWCGKTANPHYFYGCFLTPPEEPLSPFLGETFLPRETVNFSWNPIECNSYYIYYQLKVIYSLKDHRENRANCIPQTEVLNVFTTSPNYSTSTFECLGTYHWAIRACVAQKPDLDPPSLACTEWTSGDWSKFWYFNILSEKAPHGSSSHFQFCPQCRNLLPQNCQDASPHTPCGLRELVQLIFNILNCLLWCISLLLAIMLIGATGVILIFFATETEVLDRIKTAWKGYGIGLIIMFFAWTILNLIFEILNWQRQTFGDWWNPFP